MKGSTQLIATSEFPPLPGGIGNHAYNLAKQLNERGFKVSVISNARGNRQQEENYLNERLNGVNVQLIERAGSIITYFRRLNAIRKASRSLRKEDVIWLSGKFWVISAQWLKVKPGVQVIAVIHGTEIGFRSELFRKGLERCHKIISVSSFTHKKLINRYPRLAGRSTVINNGHDLHGSSIRSGMLSNGPIKLVTVGNVHPRKGQDAVIRVLPFLRKVFPGIEYHIIGIPSYQKQFTTLAKRMNVADMLTFHGKVSDNTLVDLLKEMDVFIMLSQELDNGDFEGFGIAILEANAMGIPAIGSKDSGIEDAISDGNSGFLVNHNDPDEVIDSLKKILANYSVHSENAIQWADKFRWEVIADQYVDIIK